MQVKKGMMVRHRATNNIYRVVDHVMFCPSETGVEARPAVLYMDRGTSRLYVRCLDSFREKFEEFTGGRPIPDFLEPPNAS